MKESRGAGFLATDAQYTSALERVDALAKIWAARPGVPEEDRATLGELCTAIARQLPAGAGAEI